MVKYVIFKLVDVMKDYQWKDREHCEVDGNVVLRSHEGWDYEPYYKGIIIEAPANFKGIDDPHEYSGEQQHPTEWLKENEEDKNED